MDPTSECNTSPDWTCWPVGLRNMKRRPDFWEELSNNMHDVFRTIHSGAWSGATTGKAYNRQSHCVRSVEGTCPTTQGSEPSEVIGAEWHWRNYPPVGNTCLAIRPARYQEGAAYFPCGLACFKNPKKKIKRVSAFFPFINLKKTLYIFRPNKRSNLV